MFDTKLFDNLIVKRRKNITKVIVEFLPKDMSKLISNYDYHLEGMSYILIGYAKWITRNAVFSDGRIVRETKI
jgi:hypothetical protein